MLRDSMFCLSRNRRLILLPMVSESKFCLRRSLRCFRALLFVKSNVAMIKLAWTPITKVTPNMREMTIAAIVKAIAVFRVENGMVLTMVVLALAGIGCEWREKRTKMSEPTMKRTDRLITGMWKYKVTWEFEPFLTPMRNAKNGGVPGTEGYAIVCWIMLAPASPKWPKTRADRT